MIFPQIYDRGVPNKEYLYFKVLTSVNLAFFVVFDTRYISESAIANGNGHAYWFPTTNVKAGDHIFLYTSPGTPGSKINNDGSTSYWFHWGQKETIWNLPTSAAVVFQVNTWSTSPYNK